MSGVCAVLDPQKAESGAGDVPSPVQNDASAFLYISQMAGNLMGNMQKRSGLSSSSGSGRSARGLAGLLRAEVLGIMSIARPGAMAAAV